MTSYMFPQRDTPEKKKPKETKMVREVTSKLDPKKISIRAIVTFFQVAISVLIGSGVFEFTTSALQLSAMSGIGAALSVIYNGLTQYLDQSE